MGQLLLVVPLCILRGGINLKYKPEQFELEETTIWFFKERENWATHKENYRGNCPPQVPRNLILKYTKEGEIVLDTFNNPKTILYKHTYEDIFNKEINIEIYFKICLLYGKISQLVDETPKEEDLLKKKYGT